MYTCLSLFLIQVVELDLSTVVPCCSGPKRPHDKVAVSDMKQDFETCLAAKVHVTVIPGKHTGHTYPLILEIIHSILMGLPNVISLHTFGGLSQFCAFVVKKQ